MNASSVILELAHESGFDLAGLTPLAPPPDAQRFADWLAAGHAADMDWLERNQARIQDPRALSGAPAMLLVVGLGHAREPVELPGGGRVARYAAGRDYHNRVGKGLKRLGRALEREGLLGAGRAGRALTDAAPLMERSHAAAAGLGFASKAANLLHPDHGPWFFLGELVLEAEGLEPTTAPPAGSCGTCTACIDACPTGAIVGPGQVDAGRCISYQTIENRGPVPHELRSALSSWTFGCDVCSEVCPWGSRAKDRADEWGQHPGLDQSLAELLDAPPGVFSSTWNGSPLQRPRREGLARNAALALAAQPSERGAEALARAVERDPSPLVREAAAWSLARAHGEDARTPRLLERLAGELPEGPLGALLARTRAELADGAS